MDAGPGRCSYGNTREPAWFSGTLWARYSLGAGWNLLEPSGTHGNGTENSANSLKVVYTAGPAKGSCTNMHYIALVLRRAPAPTCTILHMVPSYTATTPAGVATGLAPMDALPQEAPMEYTPWRVVQVYQDLWSIHGVMVGTVVYMTLPDRFGVLWLDG